MLWSSCTHFLNSPTLFSNLAPPYSQPHPNQRSGMILNSEMLIVAAGNNLIEAWSANNDNKHPNILIGSPISMFFKLRRPTGIVFDFENVKSVSFGTCRIYPTNLWFEPPLGHDSASGSVRDSAAEVKGNEFRIRSGSRWSRRTEASWAGRRLWRFREHRHEWTNNTCM